MYIRTKGSKIAFIVPPTRHITVSPPIGVGYMSSMLKSAGYETLILHCDFSRKNIFEAVEETLSFGPAVICISIVTMSYNRAKKMISLIKERMPEMPVIVGGAHVTALPEHSLRDLNADFAVTGEADATICELIDYITLRREGLKSIKGIMFQEEGTIVQTGHRELIEDLDSLPMPDWQSMPPDEYPKLPHQILFRKYPVAPVISTRGCEHSCAFCAVPKICRQKIRYRRPSKVADEIEYLINNFSVREIHFEDDSFTNSKSHAIAVCDEIITRELDICWSLPNGVRVDSLDSELLTAMKASGCYQVGIGIESGNDNVLGSIQKKINIDKVKQSVRLIKRYDLEVRGFFMIGFPGETEAELRDTLDLIRSLDIDYISLGICAPLPGSFYFDEYFRSASYDDIDWDMINYHTAYDTDSLDKNTVKSYLNKCIYTFYLKPSNLMRFIGALKSEQIFHAARGLYRYISE